MDTIVCEVVKQIHALPYHGMPLMIGIDGRCASGKTTLAGSLHQELGCTVFHMDDFFLQPGQRSQERLEAPGGNVDYERFREEILLPLKKGTPKISYRPYDCHSQELLLPVAVEIAPVVLIEGSYSCHPELWDFYSLHIFLTVNPAEQLKRIALRGGKNSVRQFQEQWIPLEERYFAAYQIMERCDLCFET